MPATLQHDGNASPQVTDLTRAASRHCLQLQMVVAGCTVTWSSLGTLLQPVFDPLFDRWGLPVDSYAVCVFAPLVLMISIFAALSAIWTVLGPGRWIVRLGIALAIFHLAALASVGIAMGIETIRDDYVEWRDVLAMNAALSYSFAGQIIVLLLCLWPYKLRGYRLLYFDSPQEYPHPRNATRSIPIDQRPSVSLLSGRVFLLDMFALTALVAVYLGAWYPVVVLGLDDDRMFGAPFLFMVVLVMFLGGAAVGILAVAFPLLLAMLDHRGAVFQVICQGIFCIVVTFGAIAVAVIQGLDDEVIVLAVAAVLAYLAHQLLLLLILGKPTKAFRFRLVRTRRTAS